MYTWQTVLCTIDMLSPYRFDGVPVQRAVHEFKFSCQFSKDIHVLDRKLQVLQIWCSIPGGGGGGGTQIWFRRGCAAEAAKPVPIFKPSFWRKRVPIIRGVLFKKMTFLCTLATKLGVWRKRVPIGVFIQENDVFVYFSDEMGENI